MRGRYLPHTNPITLLLPSEVCPGGEDSLTDVPIAVLAHVQIDGVGGQGSAGGGEVGEGHPGAGLDEEHAVTFFTKGSADVFPAVLEGSGFAVINQGKLLETGIGMPFPVDVKGAFADGHLEPFVGMIDLAVQPVLALDLAFRIGEGGRDAHLRPLRPFFGPYQFAFRHLHHYDGRLGLKALHGAQQPNRNCGNTN